eukprot:gene15278-16854_t
MACDNSSSASTEITELKNNSSPDVKVAKSKDRLYLESLLNKTFKIVISDGRTLVGSFLCTDKEQNVILGQCLEYVEKNGLENGEQPRTLGLAMVPGRHIISIEMDINLPEFKSAAHTLGKVNFASTNS